MGKKVNSIWLMEGLAGEYTLYVSTGHIQVEYSDCTTMQQNFTWFGTFFA